MEAKAILRTARISPQKARLVADQVRGMPVARAADLLEFSDKKAAALIRKVLWSATEAAMSVREAARVAGVPYLVAIIRPENQPSQRVAEKIGLRLEQRVFKNGGDALVFGAAL